MAARWIGIPLSYSTFRAAVGARAVAVGATAVATAAQNIVVEEQAIPTTAYPDRLAVHFILQNPNGTRASHAAPCIVEDPNRTLSATLADSWCRALGLDPTALGIDDKP